MACRGVHFSLSLHEIDKLKTFDNDDDRLEYLTNEIEEFYFVEQPRRVSETDKAWDAMNLCFQIGAERLGKPFDKLKLTIFGGESLYRKSDYIMDLKTPAQAKDVSDAICLVTKDLLQEWYNAFDPSDYGVPKSEDDFEYTWEYFTNLIPFYRLAADESRFVLFTVDQ